MVQKGTTARRSWRLPWIVLLLSAAIVLVGLLAMQSVYASRLHREVAEGVLRDYAGVVADEFIRRTSVAVGYQVYYSLTGELERQIPSGEPMTLPSLEVFREQLAAKTQPAGQLVRALLLYQPDGRWQVSGASFDDAAKQNLLEAFADITPETRFSFIHLDQGSRLRSVLYFPFAPAGAEQASVIGLEFDLADLEPWFAGVVGQGPLLPSSLGQSVVENELLSMQLTGPDGRKLYELGERFDPQLTKVSEFGEVYSGVFRGFSLRTAIHPDAAQSLIIGGLPRSRLPVLFSVMFLTVGLLAAALIQLRRERALVRMRTDFVSRVSHELRTPLTQIRLFAESLMLKRYRDDGERDRYLEIIDQESRRLGHLVENVLQFSKGDRDTIELNCEDMELGPLLSEARERFMPLATARSVAIEVTQLQPVHVCVDRDAMLQVLLNLLDNAVKFGPAGQTVRMQVSAQDGWARIEVDDEGSGVPPSERERIWQRWRRLERDRRAAVAGTGIGLTVVRELIRQQSGKAHVESAPSGGARFVIQLPCHLPQAPHASQLVQDSHGDHSR